MYMHIMGDCQEGLAKKSDPAIAFQNASKPAFM
jgi:hypothetical protein